MTKYSETVGPGGAQESRGYQGSGLFGGEPPWGRSVRALACLLALLCPLLGPDWAYAEPELPPESAAAPAGAPKLQPGHPMQLNGLRGVFWPLATAQLLAREHKMLFELTTLNMQQAKKITLLEERLQLQLAAKDTLQLQVDAHQEAMDGCAEREAKQVLQTVKAQEKLSRARWTWFSVGLVATAVVFGGGMLIASGN